MTVATSGVCVAGVCTIGWCLIQVNEAGARGERRIPGQAASGLQEGNPPSDVSGNIHLG